MPSSLTRRSMLGSLSLSLLARAQMASRGVQPSARPKASGLPFDSRLIDISAQAGLTLPVICGDEDRSKYILKATGGGVAFLDDNNDGWLDIFLLSQTRWEGAPPGTSNRLYRNNRDRGLGLLLGVELESHANAGRVMYRALGFGLSFKVTMGKILTLTPPLAISREEMDAAISILDRALGH